MLELHTDGRYIKDANGAVKILVGPNGLTQNAGFVDYCTGTGGTTFNETALRNSFAAMVSWGFNCIRIMTTVRWWLENCKETLNGSESCDTRLRDAVEQVVQIAAEYNIYVVFSFWTVDIVGRGQDYRPYPPGLASAQNFDTIRNSADFLQVWAGDSTSPATSPFLWRFDDVDQTLEDGLPRTSLHVNNDGIAPKSVSELLNGYPNVIYDLYNEPAGDDSGWSTVTGQVAAALRARGDNHLILAQCGYCGSFYSFFTYMNNAVSEISPRNIVFSNHIYRASGSFPDNAYLYADVYADLCTKTQGQGGFGMKYVLDQGYPVIIGETGASNSVADDVTCLDNTLRVCNEQGVSWLSWEWRTGMQMSNIGSSFAPTTTGVIVQDRAGDVSQGGGGLSQILTDVMTIATSLVKTSTYAEALTQIRKLYHLIIGG